MDTKNNNQTQDEEREKDYAVNPGTEMPGNETDPQIIRNPDIHEDEDQDERNDQRPTPGTL